MKGARAEVAVCWPDARAESASGRPSVVAAACLGGALSVGYLCLITGSLMTGDAVVYLDQIRALDLGQRTAHLGYYLAGILFTRAVGRQDAAAINAMSAMA